MEEQFAQVVNLMWGECISNLGKTLEETEQKKFTNNDYYYLYVIESLNKPNFSTIADALNLTKPGVTAIVRKLSNMGLVKKCQSDEDKRVYFVTLTQKGKNILNGDRKVYKRATETITSFCKTDDQRKFIEAMLQMLVDQFSRKKNG